MRSKLLLMGLVLTGIILISGCAGQPSGPSCPDCPNPGSWSECTEEAVKSRTNYKCSAETNYTCESYTENKTCSTEMKIKGAGGILDAVISPTLDENVKGIIKVEASTVPEGTEMVKFIFAPQEVQLGSQMDMTKVVIEVDTSGADGWKAFFDTTNVENGLYQILIGSTYEGAPSESPWLDYSLTQVVVKN